MKVIDDLKKETINVAVQQLASGANQIDTDHSTSYVELKDFVNAFAGVVPVPIDWSHPQEPV